MEAYELLMHEVVALRSQMQEIKRSKREEQSTDEVLMVKSPREERQKAVIRTKSLATVSQFKISKKFFH